ncbi:MAG: hypothetical protein HQL21_05140, partial [Candidatus Omnitrophica bacterium]|nr:hypothetical protein [Candidatus Omnitrophota bacterium]
MRIVLPVSFVVGTLILFTTPALAKSPVVAEQKPVMVKGMHLDGHGDKKEFLQGMMKSSSLSMVATSDGGVIVLVGGKLKKYDKDLSLIKEVVVEADTAMPRHKD